jgi:hypothetical protein
VKGKRQKKPFSLHLLSSASRIKKRGQDGLVDKKKRKYIVLTAQLPL